MKKLTIIVPVYNVEKYLNKCLDSLVLQSEDKCEIILIDDGSTDLSSQICEEYERKYNNVVCYHKSNGGLSDARNYGIDKASGEYIWFIDSDDFLCDNGVNEILNLIEYCNSDVLVCKSKVIDEKNKVYDECIYSIVEKEYGVDEYFELLAKNPKGVIFCAQYHICKTKLIKENSIYFLKGIIHEDELWTPQILMSAKKIYYSDLNIYYHFMRNDSIMHATKIEQSGRCYLIVANTLFEIFEKNKDKNLKYLNDRCVNMYLQAVWKSPQYVKNTFKYRLNLLKKSLYIKTRIKSLLYLLFPNLYLKIHSIVKE